MSRRWAVVLAGGVGSRFWPLSTPSRPKQLLPLVSPRAMLVESVDRLAELVPAERTLILTNASLVPAIRALLPEVPPENVIAEPRPAGTAAALAWAAHEIAARPGGGADAVMLSVHADWSVGDPETFRRTLAQAADAAHHERALVTVGIVATRPDPGFGYIQPGEEVAPGVRRVARFIEKPDRERAAEMMRQGYLWNSGIFVWRVDDFLAELRAHTPEVAPALDTCSGDAERFFAAVTPVSVDVGLLERSDRVRVLAGDFQWDDVGTWASLARVRPLDAENNAVSGPVRLVEARGNVAHAEGNLLVLYGVSELVVVAQPGLTLVTTVERAADLKTLIDRLPADIVQRT